MLLKVVESVLNQCSKDKKVYNFQFHKSSVSGVLDKKVDSLILVDFRFRRWASSVASQSAGSHLSHWSRRLPLQSVTNKKIYQLLIA